MDDRSEQETPPFFRIWLCGAFRVERRVGEHYEAIRTAEWGGSSYPRLLLKALLCCPGRQGRREALIELLWPDMDFEQAVLNFNTATTKLRAALRLNRGQESLLLTEQDASVYRLAEQRQLWVDVEEAFALLKEAERLGRQPLQSVTMLEEAVKYLSRGTFLEDEEGLWLYGRRKDIKEALYNGRRWLAEAYVEQGMIGQAELQWRALLTDDPTDEDILRQAMMHFHRYSMATKARRLYQQIVEQLAEEGLELSRETQAFAQHLRDVPFTSLPDQTSPLQVASSVSPLHLSVVSEEQRLFCPVEPERFFPVQMGIVTLGLEDPTVWFGGKLAHLLTIAEDYCRYSTFCLDLQEKIGKELNSMHPKSDDEIYTHSRRQLLITLATLPTALLLSMLQGRHTAGRVEYLLTRCSASLTACWHLMRGSEYAVVEELLPTYLPLLTSLAQEESKHQRTAASLATQGYRLKGILALHRNDVKTRDASFQQAVYYAEIAQNPGLLVAALISLAYHRPDPVGAERLYQKALVYEQVISPLQRSRLYAELSVACAQQNREDDAIHYLNLAQQVYPAQPESDPGFLYAEFSPSSMILEKGRVHLALTQHQPDGCFPQQAWETFAGIETGPANLLTSERIRYEIVNYQAETALALRDRDLCCEYVQRGAQGAVVLGSVKRQREVIATRNKVLKLWPHDGRVKELKYLFA